MKRIAFGNTELQVSRIGLGGYPFSGVNRARDWDPYSATGRLTVLATIHRALDLGINYIDTAPGYGDGHSERLIGEVMRTRRDECVLATKVDRQVLDLLRPAGPELIPGIRVVATPGHSVGHSSLLFESEGLRVVVAGDAAMTRDFFWHDDYYFNTVDPEAAVTSIATVARAADVVVPGHDNYFLNRRTV